MDRSSSSGATCRERAKIAVRATSTGTSIRPTSDPIRSTECSHGLVVGEAEGQHVRNAAQPPYDLGRAVEPLLPADGEGHRAAAEGKGASAGPADPTKATATTTTPLIDAPGVKTGKHADQGSVARG